jgi:hypothetical protein
MGGLVDAVSWTAIQISPVWPFDDFYGASTKHLPAFGVQLGRIEPTEQLPRGIRWHFSHLPFHSYGRADPSLGKPFGQQPAGK